MDREHGIVGKELMNGRAAGGTTKAIKKGSKGSKPDWHSDKDRKQGKRQKQEQL